MRLLSSGITLHGLGYGSGDKLVDGFAHSPGMGLDCVLASFRQGDGQPVEVGSVPFLITALSCFRIFLRCRSTTSFCSNYSTYAGHLTSEHPVQIIK